MEANPRDLEERCAEFAANVRMFVRCLPRTISNREDVKQLVRSSGSVAANCIEANEALGRRDCVMRFRLCRKEAKESRLWLRLVNTGNAPAIDAAREKLRRESHELLLILSTIVKKLE